MLDILSFVRGGLHLHVINFRFVIVLLNEGYKSKIRFKCCLEVVENFVCKKYETLLYINHPENILDML